MTKEEIIKELKKGPHEKIKYEIEEFLKSYLNEKLKKDEIDEKTLEDIKEDWPF